MRAIGSHLKTPGQQLAVGLEHGLRLFGKAEHGAGYRRQAGSLFGQFHPPGSAAQQGDLVMLLQRLDVASHCRLADEQPRRSAGEAAFTGNGVEGTQLEQVHFYRPDL